MRLSIDLHLTEGVAHHRTLATAATSLGDAYDAASRVGLFTLEAIRALVLLEAISGALTLHSGHDRGEDFAQYTLYARNLAQGRPYADTGYICRRSFCIPAGRR